jgi:hypothetical protein
VDLVDDDVVSIGISTVTSSSDDFDDEVLVSVTGTMRLNMVG